MEELSAWMEEVSSQMPRLSKPQAAVLAMWSFSLVMTQTCSVSGCSLFLAELLATKENTMRQRLREWYWEGPAKKGRSRQSVLVQSQFAWLLGWVLSKWQGQQLALAVDATTLGDRLVVLAVSVVYRGVAIPVAWKVMVGNQPGRWKPEWLRLLRLIHRAIPAEMMVIVLSDRGISQPWLFKRIRRLGWHPLLRITISGTFQPQGQQHYRPLKCLVPQPGTCWQGPGRLYKSKRFACTLLCRWEAGYEHPWLLITDLSPTQADACWYGLRAWIEQGFKVSKRAGWQWHRSRITDPDRAARVWLVMAVATLWLVGVGGYAEELAQLATFPPLEVTSPGPLAPKARQVSVFRRGWIKLLVALLKHQPLPDYYFFPEPWPDGTVLLDLSLPQAQLLYTTSENTYP